MAETPFDVPIDDGDSVTLVARDGEYVAIRSFTSVERGDTIHAVASSNIELHSVPLELPVVSGARVWDVNTPYSGVYADAQFGDHTIDVPVSVTTTPIIAVASANEQVVAMYGARAAEIRDSGLAVTESLAWQPTVVELTGLHDASDPNIYGAIMIGPDALPIYGYDNGVVPVPTGFGDRIEIGASTSSLSLDQPDEFVWTSVLSKTTPGSTVSLAFGVPALPTLSNVQLTPTKVSWTATGSTTYDLTQVEVYAIMINGAYQWTIAAPNDVTEVQLPSLPADLAPPLVITTYVSVQDLSDYDGYHDAIGYAAPRADTETRQYRALSIPQSAMVAPLKLARHPAPPNAIVAGLVY